MHVHVTRYYTGISIPSHSAVYAHTRILYIYISKGEPVEALRLAFNRPSGDETRTRCGRSIDEEDTGLFDTASYVSRDRAENFLTIFGVDCEYLWVCEKFYENARDIQNYALHF